MLMYVIASFRHATCSASRNEFRNEVPYFGPLHTKRHAMEVASAEQDEVSATRHRDRHVTRVGLVPEA